MPRKIVKLFSSLAISGLLALAPAAPAVAQQVAFTVTGAITNAAQGYAVGQPISMTFVLDAAAARLALATPVSICCSGTLSWQQNLLAGEP